MTSVVIGGRNRTLKPERHIFISGRALAENFDSQAALIEQAEQIIWAFYALDEAGHVAYDLTLRHTETILSRLIKCNKKIIFLSTDGVFSGSAGPYSEMDKPDATTNYGRIKHAQENMMQNCVRLRFTIFGPSFNLERMLLLEMAALGQIKVDRPNQIFSPISTITLNNVIDQLRTQPYVPAIYHLAGTALSKTDCVNRLRRAIGLPQIQNEIVDWSNSNLALKSNSHNFSFDSEVKLAIAAKRNVAYNSV
jgi:dTDP-4-dehydrorhamnose reductase